MATVVFIHFTVLRIDFDVESFPPTCGTLPASHPLVLLVPCLPCASRQTCAFLPFYGSDAKAAVVLAGIKAKTLLQHRPVYLPFWWSMDTLWQTQDWLQNSWILRTLLAKKSPPLSAGSRPRRKRMVGRGGPQNWRCNLHCHSNAWHAKVARTSGCATSILEKSSQAKGSELSAEFHKSEKLPPAAGALRPNCEPSGIRRKLQVFSSPRQGRTPNNNH